MKPFPEPRIIGEGSDAAPEKRGTMTEQTYTQNWKAYDAAQEHEQEHVEVLLRDLCDLLYQPEYDRGRPRLPVSDMAYCIGLKVYQGMSRRRTMTAVRRARERGFLDCVPSSSTITRYMDDPALTPVLKYLVEESARPLEAVETQFAVDSTGFATNSYVRWYDHKWGKERKEVQWVKCHLMCGVKTNVVTAVEVSEGDANDSPFLPRLLETTVQIFPGAKELSADKAYLSRNNFAAAERAGIDLYVPFKTNSRATHPGRERSRAWEKAYFFYQYHREEFLEHYHMRSDAESTIGMSKAKTGAFLRSRTQRAQFNEVLAKMLIHNLCVLVTSMYELGIEPEFRSQLRLPGSHEGDSGPEALATAA